MKIVIVGPTGVGKTKLSIELAKWLDAEVINADAVQVYEGLDIGSAKVLENEKEGIKHLLFDIKKPNEEYSVKDYQDDVRKILDNNPTKNYCLVGGTGLYVCGALMDYRFYEDELEVDLSDKSNEELYEIAIKKNPTCNIPKENRIRLERFIKRNNENIVEPKLMYDDICFIGLTTNRNNLYNIINNRVDKMMANGLVDEVKDLLAKYPNSKILNRAIGYKEIISYLKKEITLDEATELIKKNSRHYAKRQYTWFNNKMNIKWFEVNYDNFNETIYEVKKYIEHIINARDV